MYTFQILAVASGKAGFFRTNLPQKVGNRTFVKEKPLISRKAASCSQILRKSHKFECYLVANTSI
jgi:hypothetical protein